MRAASTIDRAHGRWKEILPRLGVDSKFLVNRHGPCPLCGGRDRFRFDDKDGSGSYYCNGCGAGVGVILLRKMHAWDFSTACNEIDKIIGTDRPLAAKSPRPADSPPRRAEIVERTIAGAADDGIVARYLRGRGLSVFPAVLRGHAALPYRCDGRLVGHYPAMVAPITGPDGRLESAHRTYLADLPQRKKILPPVATISGASVRLFDHNDTLGIAEGIETAIAAHEIFSLPTWAALSAGGMESFSPPPNIERLVIFADNDKNFVGQKAAFTLACRMSRELPELAVEVEIPPHPGTDWLDVLNEESR